MVWGEVSFKLSVLDQLLTFDYHGPTTMDCSLDCFISISVSKRKLSLNLICNSTIVVISYCYIKDVKFKMRISIKQKLFTNLYFKN